MNSKYTFARSMLALCLLGSLLLGLQTATGPVSAASPPPDIASYTITARYDADTHQITAEETATYRNTTSAHIPDLVLHLYLNAFSSLDTTWMQEAGPNHRGFSYDSEHPGWVRIERIALADGTPLEVEPVDDDETLVRVALPKSIAPGEELAVDIDFTAQLPAVFARTGWADEGEFVMAGQWFPKFGVWEEGAWDAYPFHANSEFYADFGHYDVTLTVPEGWMVGSTGVADGEPQVNGDGTATHHLVAEHVIDFVWTASPHFREMTRPLQDITVRVLYYPARRSMALRSLKATVGAFKRYSEWYGEYGQGLYSELTVVIVPQGAGGAGGMEYPTLFTVGASGNSPPCVRMIEVEAVHELGHQWFQSVVATNEAEEPWLDEGFTDYSATRAMADLYPGGIFDCLGWDLSYTGMHMLQYRLHPEVPMAGKAWEFDMMGYGIATYSKPALALMTLQNRVGDEAMTYFMRTYFDRYAFEHPTAEDVRAVMEETLGAEAADWFFEDFVYDDGVLDARIQSFNEQDVLLDRTKGACIPTTIRLVGPEDQPRETRTRPWPCDAGSLVEDNDTRVIEIDPEGDILLDTNLANNGLRRYPDWGAWLGVVVRWMRALQDSFQGGVPW